MEAVVGDKLFLVILMMVSIFGSIENYLYIGLR